MGSLGEDQSNSGGRRWVNLGGSSMYQILSSVLSPDLLLTLLELMLVKEQMCV